MMHCSKENPHTKNYGKTTYFLLFFSAMSTGIIHYIPNFVNLSNLNFCRISKIYCTINLYDSFASKKLKKMLDIDFVLCYNKYRCLWRYSVSVPK